MSDRHPIARADDRWIAGIVGVEILSSAVVLLDPSRQPWAAAIPTLLTAVNLVLARQDWAQLGRAFRFERFHWLWGVFAPVYVIGRGAYLYRATGSGLVRTVIYSVLIAAAAIAMLILPLGAAS